jgi:ATP-dependent Lon protease
MEKTQREYYLNEQMKAIQKELGDNEDSGDELGELAEKNCENQVYQRGKGKGHRGIEKT